MRRGENRIRLGVAGEAHKWPSVRTVAEQLAALDKIPHVQVTAFRAAQHARIVIREASREFK